MAAQPHAARVLAVVLLVLAASRGSDAAGASGRGGTAAGSGGSRGGGGSGAAAGGWRMVDRFAGFRYEVIGALPDPAGFTTEAVDEADRLSGFGWVQISPTGSVVGEFRGNKAAARAFEGWLRDGSTQRRSVRRVDVHHYADTKIRYHFSHFKLVDPGRKTCFEEAPHACPTRQHSSSHGHGGEL